MRLIISDRAVSDLADVWTYIARDNADAADSFVDRLYRLCEKLAVQPGMGRERDELIPGIRSFPAGRYLVFYRSSANVVEVVRILSAYRDLASLF